MKQLPNTKKATPLYCASIDRSAYSLKQIVNASSRIRGICDTNKFYLLKSCRYKKCSIILIISNRFLHLYRYNTKYLYVKKRYNFISSTGKIQGGTVVEIMPFDIIKQLNMQSKILDTLEYNTDLDPDPITVYKQIARGLYE